MKKLIFVLTLAVAGFSATAQSSSPPPNVIVILADDLGYGDLGSYGHPTIRTPQLDRMAREGMRFTQFYVAANVCSPSRASLLTGRLPIRNGVTGNLAVFFPHSATGLPLSEITLADALKTKGYRTGIVGKWHLGSQPDYLPNKRGFDYYFGIPYSNDMIPQNNYQIPYPPLPLYENEKVLETDPDQTTLTNRYTDAAIRFIKGSKGKPFFLYYPNNAPHTPLYASPAQKGKSKRGIYGDVVEEFDNSIGRILKTLKEQGIDKNTIVIFLSDNGPWLTQGEDGGSAGLLSEGKGSTYEGGMRVPAIARWPGHIPAGVENTALISSLDLFPTILHWAGAELPKDRQLDGTDLGTVFKGSGKGRDVFFYYEGQTLHAIRKGPWKAAFVTHAGYAKAAPEKHETPLLYNLEVDPSEKYDQSAKQPELIAAFKALYQQQVAALTAAPGELDKTIPGALDDAFKARLKAARENQQNK